MVLPASQEAVASFHALAARLRLGCRARLDHSAYCQGGLAIDTDIMAMSKLTSAKETGSQHDERCTQVLRHRQNSRVDLLDLPDPLLEGIVAQAAPKAACLLGCTCRRLQALYMEHEPRNLAAMAKGAFPYFWVQTSPYATWAGKAQNAAEQADIDLKKFFQPLPADLGLLSDVKGGRDYDGEVKLTLLPELHMMNSLGHAAKRSPGLAASILQLSWPTTEEIETSSAGHAWSELVRQAAAKCMTLISYVSYFIQLPGLDKAAVKEMLPVIGNCAITQVLGVLGASEAPPGTTQSWKQVQSSGYRRRLCTLYLLKYRGLRVLVTCNP